MMFKNYLLWGKGFGLRWVVLGLLLAITGIFIWLGVVFHQQTAWQVFKAFPPLEIAQGRLVSPRQTYQEIKANPDFPIMIDTRDNPQINLHFSDGLFLTSDTLFMKIGAVVQAFPLHQLFGTEQQVSLSPQQVKQIVHLFFTLTFGLLACFISIFNYIVLTGATWLFLWIVGRKVPLKICARCSALGTLVVLACIMIALFIGVILSGSFLMLIILGQCLLLGRYYRLILDMQILNQTLEELPTYTPKEAKEMLKKQNPALRPKKRIKTSGPKKDKSSV